MDLSLVGVRMKRLAALTMAVGLAVAGAANAQSPALEDPEANIVAELVVTAKEPGPAWWRVEDADTTVWILGIGENLPTGMTWDHKYLDRRLKGADSIIVGTRIGLAGRLRDIPLFLRTINQMKTKTPLEETLSPPVRARFVAARERLGQPANRYSEWKGLVAGMRLLGDAAPKDEASVVPGILKQAKREKVKEVDPARYQAAPFLKEATATLTPALHEQCLADALTDLETPRDPRAPRAWTRGDVGAALTGSRRFEKCLLVMGGGADLWRRSQKDLSEAIAAALARPGHSIALVSLRPLLAEDGVIEQLEAKGLKVIGPGEGE